VEYGDHIIASILKINSVGKIIVAVAVGLAILASLYILFTPVNIQILTATGDSGGSEIARETTVRQSWYEVQGTWGVIVVLIVCGLYGWGYHLARKEVYTWLGVLSLGLLGLSYLAGFSIGLFYLPAAVVMLLGSGLLIFTRYRQEAR
jgi:hypothetical protein